MGKYLSRRDFLKGSAAAGLGAAAMGLFHLPVMAEESTDKYIPGTYTDTEETPYSSITVTMEFSADAITGCEITSEGPQDLLSDLFINLPVERFAGILVKKQHAVSLPSEIGSCKRS